MLLNIIVQVVEGLHLRQVFCGDGDLISVLYKSYQIYEVDAVKLQHLLHGSIRGKLTLFDFKLFFQQAIHLLNNLIACHNFINF